MRDAHSSVPSTLPSFDDVPSRPPFGPDSTSPIHFSHLTSPYPIIRRSSQPILPSQIVRTLLQPGDDPPNVSFPNHPSDPHSDDRIVHIATTTTTIPNSIFHQSHKGFNPTPASLLPVELLREVFRHTPPDAHRDIFAFSAVNSFWRGVCLSLPELFSTANWDDWSVPAIVEWCRRGNNDGLVVKLGQRAVRRAVMSMESLPYQPLPAIARGRGIARNHSYNGQALANDHPSFQENVSKYIRLLDETSLSWISFSMEFDRGDPTMSLVHELLPRWSCPQLRALTLIDLDNESQNPPFLVLPNMAPYLEELICKDVHIIRASPWANLQRVILDVDFWTQGIERSSIFQTISHAEMLVFDGCGFSGVGGGNIVLHNVRQVTLVDDSVTGFAEWTLRHISFPRATRLTLRGTRPYPNEFPDAEKQVWNKAFPEVVELTLQLWKPWIAIMLPLLSRETESDLALLFPKLVSLNVTAYDWHDRRTFSGTKDLYERMPAQIERALLKFLGLSDDDSEPEASNGNVTTDNMISRPQVHIRRSGRSLQRLSITGITISSECERQIRSLVDHVKVCSSLHHRQYHLSDQSLYPSLNAERSTNHDPQNTCSSRSWLVILLSA